MQTLTGTQEAVDFTGSQADVPVSPGRLLNPVVETCVCAVVLGGRGVGGA